MFRIKKVTSKLVGPKTISNYAVMAHGTNVLGTTTCIEFPTAKFRRATCFERELEGSMILWLPQLLKVQFYDYNP